MSQYSASARVRTALQQLRYGLTRALCIACALVLALLTLSCTPRSNMIAQSKGAQGSLSAVDSFIWGLLDASSAEFAAIEELEDKAVAASEYGIATPAPSHEAIAQPSVASVAVEAAPTAELVDTTAVAAAEPQESFAQEMASEAALPVESEAVVAASADEVADGSSEIRFDWTSVDTYHENPPLWNALGKFEDRWYAAHNFVEIGAGIASLSEGDRLRVDGVLLEVSWIYDGSYESTYDEVRSIVGAESYCFQTCTGVGTGIIVVVCYPV